VLNRVCQQGQDIPHRERDASPRRGRSRGPCAGGRFIGSVVNAEVAMRHGQKLPCWSGFVPSGGWNQGAPVRQHVLRRCAGSRSRPRPLPEGRGASLLYLF
jgi:hypothetical protein